MNLGLPRNTTLYSLGKTNTFRAASGALFKYPPFDGFGTNLQNIEVSARSMYVPDDGYEFGSVDQAGAEAKIVAYLAAEGKYRDLFIHNIKPHTYVALHMFKEKWKAKAPHIGIDDVCFLQPKDLTKHDQWKELDKLIKSSDEWPLTERYYYLAKQTAHCVDDKHEVLTKNGWINVAQYNGIDEIATWDLWENIKFEKPQAWNTHKYDGRVYDIGSPQFSQQVTPNHKMVYMTNGYYKTKTAEQLSKFKHETKLPLCGMYVGGNASISIAEARFIAALQADGNIPYDGCIRFRFKKQRKIDRIISLMKELNITYERFLYPQDRIHEFIIKKIHKYTSIFGVEKKWDSWLLEWPIESLKALTEELRFWDGSYQEEHHHKREVFISEHRQNVEWMKTILHLTGRQGTVGQPTKQNIWILGINNRKFARCSSVRPSTYNGFVYCPTTSTGFFMVRRNGKISVSGNSANYGIKGPTFRMNVLEKSGGQIALSSKDADFFLTFYRGMFPEIPRWNYDTYCIVQKTRTLYNLFGHPRYFGGEQNGEFYRNAYAFVPQSTVGEITHIAFRDLQNYIEKENLDWHLLANTHDSYLMEYKPAEREHALSKMKEFMEQELTSPSGIKFKMGSDSKHGNNWSFK